jgi:hypothetical protein
MPTSMYANRRPATVLAVALVAIGLLVTLVAPAAADSAAEATRPVPVHVHAKPDPLKKSGHNPYVAFALTGAQAGQKYRITQLDGPSSPTKGPACASALTTEWTPAFGRGNVVFDLEPVTNGKYFDFPGYEPCHGRYILKLERRASSTSYPTLRRFSFDYPSFKIRYLPLRPF